MDEGGYEPERTILSSQVLGKKEILQRYKLAESIFGVFSQVPGVDCIVLGGSVAAGTADQYSDIEIGIYWNNLPSEQWLKEYLQSTFNSIPIHIHKIEKVNLILCPFQFKEYIIDMKHQLSGTVDELVRNLRDDSIININQQLLFEAIQTCLPFPFGAKLFNEWKSKLIYPSSLTKSIVTTNLKSLHPLLEEMRILSKIDSLTLFYMKLSEFHSIILETLLAINKRFSRGDSKWQNERLSNLEIVPKDCNQQITNHYKKDPTYVFPDISNFVIQLIDILKSLPLNLDNTSTQFFIYQYK